MQRDNKLYMIGEISKLCNISIKTLRYYDEIDLLKPEIIDGENNYRYYSKEQVLAINIIKDLKLIGFSLKEIKSLLKREDISILLEKIKVKLQETDKNIRELEHLRSKIQAYLDLLIRGKEILNYSNHSENRNLSKYRIEIKKIPDCWVIYTRYRCPCNPSVFIQRYSQLYNLIEKHHLHSFGALKAIFHDHYTQFDYENADIEVCVPIVEQNNIPHITRKFGDFLAATTLHHGKYSNMIEAYKALMDWIKVNGYELCGPAVEKYIIDSGTTSYTENYITEIILPITKASNSNI